MFLTVGAGGGGVRADEDHGGGAVAVQGGGGHLTAVGRDEKQVGERDSLPKDFFALPLLQLETKSLFLKRTNLTGFFLETYYIVQYIASLLYIHKGNVHDEHFFVFSP